MCVRDQEALHLPAGRMERTLQEVSGGGAPMTEPSQEAVNLVDRIAHLLLSRPNLASPLVQESIRHADSALRALEQRTRLETLERVLKHAQTWGTVQEWLKSEIASLQPRAESEWDKECRERNVAMAQPREAPKAEEQIQCPACQRGDWCPESAPPQPGPEEGR